ncbi:MAG TPA: hypothetical protein VEU62_00150 [Bryobacterales bacterium]|nr:hypothetical protein [Bryobacterales bacterium]
MDINDVVSLVGRLAEQRLALTQHVDRFQREISVAVLALAEGQKLLQDEVREGFRRLTEEQQRLAEAQRRLAELQQHTEEKLNALIAVVDGMIRRPPAP